jgi:hypothetical protein
LKGILRNLTKEKMNRSKFETLGFEYWFDETYKYNYGSDKVKITIRPTIEFGVEDENRWFELKGVYILNHLSKSVEQISYIDEESLLNFMDIFNGHGDNHAFRNTVIDGMVGMLVDKSKKQIQMN